MASGVVKAVLDKYAGLTAANFPSATRPNIYFAQNVTGGSLPVVVVKDEKVRRERLNAAEVMETSRLSVEVYAATAGDADTIFTAVLFNGGAVGSGAGFEDGTLSGLGAGYRLNDMHHEDARRGFARWTGSVERAHTAAFTLVVEVIAGSF